MSINIHDGSSFNEVSKVHVAPKYSTNLKESQRVWVHNGTKYVMVKGRLLEVVWEVDMSTWGGTSWSNSNRLPHNNKSLSMFVLSGGDLLNVVTYVINNNSSNQYSTNRYALQKISSSDGSISNFGTTSWSGWSAVSGYHQTDQPIGVVKCNDYYVAYSEHGIFYVFSSGGSYKSKFENETWHTDGSAKCIPKQLEYGINVDFFPSTSSSGCIYYVYYDQNKNDSDSSSYTVSCYRLGISGSSLQSTSRRHYSGEREARYYGFSSCLTVGKKIPMFFDCKSSSYPVKLVVFSGNYSYSSSTTEVSALCSLSSSSGDGVIDNLGETPCFVDDDYVYTIRHSSPDKIRKRSLSDLSLIWELSTPYFYSEYEQSNIHQPCPSVDGGFMLPNGTIIYPDGTYDKAPNALYEDSTNNHQIISQCYDETLGFGYLNYYYGDYSSSTDKYNYNGNAVNKIIKFKEVRR